VDIINDNEVNYLVCLKQTHSGSQIYLMNREGNKLTNTSLELMYKGLMSPDQPHGTIKSTKFVPSLQKYLVYNHMSIKLAETSGKVENLFPASHEADQSLWLPDGSAKHVCYFKNIVYFMTHSPPGFTGVDLETRAPLEETYPLDSTSSVLAFTLLGQEQDYQQMKYSFYFNNGMVANPKIFYCTRQLKVTEFDINADGKRLRKTDSYFLQSDPDWNPTAFAVHPRYFGWCASKLNVHRKIYISTRRDLKQVSRYTLQSGRIIA
jgi:hypothetical protein